MNAKPSIGILGAGVSGLTTGIILNLDGYPTTIYAEHLPTWPSYERNVPEFSSLYAAASILPHAVDIENTVEHLQRSHRFFQQLSNWPNFNVRQQPHYEIFERPRRTVPAYARAMDNFRSISPPETRLQRDTAVPVSGWSYDAYVVDMPSYMRQLLTLYQNTGGTIIQRHLTRNAFLALDQELLVNCGGLSSRSLVNDSTPYEVTRGHLVYVDVPDAVRAERPFPFSYNYMPYRDVYAQPDGRPADVYFYPRPDRWVLGGSRQLVDSYNHTEPIDDNCSTTIMIDGLEVPEPVITLNRHLLLLTTGVDITEYPLQAAFGYRFERHPVRLEYSLENGRTMFHNYGHGGAGVTLSWSCAVELLDRIVAYRVAE